MIPFAYRRGAARRSVPRAAPEHRLQIAVAKYLLWALPDTVLWTATLNGAHLSASQRAKMKAAGLRRGIADLVLLVPGRGVFMIELKATTGLSAEQKAWRAGMGLAWATAKSLEDVEAALISFGITPRCAISQANRYHIEGVTE